MWESPTHLVLDRGPNVLRFVLLRTDLSMEMNGG
jgi:hypothetical protein